MDKFPHPPDGQMSNKLPSVERKVVPRPSLLWGGYNLTVPRLEKVVQTGIMIWISIIRKELDTNIVYKIDIIIYLITLFTQLEVQVI